MAGFTPYWHLLWLTAQDNLYLNGAEFTDSDRFVIDALLYQGATGHHHDGASSAYDNPSSAPTFVTATSGGTIPADTTCYYEYTFCDPLGLESAPSPVGSVTTSAALASPGAPSVTPTTGTGTNPAGTYSYKLTNYVGTSTQETLAGSAGMATLSAEGENVLHWSATSGASGVNIYVLQPDGTQYLFLTSVAAGTTTFTDNGGIGANCNRFLPGSNTTNAQNEVTVSYASPPSDWTVNLYRTFTSGSWGGSQIATGLTGDPFVDTGAAANGVTPPTASRIPSDPSKIELTDAAEVQGTLPMANVAGFPVVVPFSFPVAPLSEQDGITVWVCECTSATIVSVRASLGVGYTPNAQPVIVDVQKGPETSNPPTFSSIFAAATPVYPEVAVGKQIGTPVTPVVTSLVKGDALTANILQGGGGSGTDGYLTVDVLLYVIP